MSWMLLADGPGYEGLFADFDTTFWSAALRIAQAMVAAAPFLVAGVVAAGLLRGLVGAKRVRAILGVGHWTGPLRAWALGILLPICSLGAIPVARELRRAGIPSGTVLSFVLVAPVLNPVSIIYGLSHIEPRMLALFAVGTFCVSVGIGLVWNRIVSASRDAAPEEIEEAPADSVARLVVAGDTAARALVGPAFIDYGLALLAVGVLGAFLPHGILQTGLTRDNPLAPIVMGLVAIPVYVTPTEVMMHFGHIVRDGYSLGAAFALIVLGAGANVGVANWLRRDYGAKALLMFVGMLVGSTFVIGLTADRTVVHGNATVADHTHAFDSFTRLARVGDGQANLAWVYSELRKSLTRDQVYGIGLLACFAISGVVLRLSGDRLGVKRWRTPSADGVRKLTTPAWNPALSPRQLCFVGVFSAVSLAGVGLYVYYPSADELIEDMNYVRANVYDAVREEDAVETARRIEQWRSTVRKLPTSAFLRSGRVESSQQESVSEVLYSLDTLEAYMQSGKYREAQVLITFVDKVYGHCRNQFRARGSS